jgi:hypothetical protein
VTINQAIQKSLRAECPHDFLAPHQSFSGPVTRPAFIRLIALLDYARLNQLGNTVELAEEFSVSVKTIQRDLGFLRRNLGVQTKWIDTQNRFTSLVPPALLRFNLPNGKAAK